MKGKFNLLTGSRILEEVDSPINGKVRVIQSLAWGNHVQAGSLTQSGGVVTSVWKHSLKKVKQIKKDVERSLILGLGGGSAAKLIRNFWPDSKITGVEIDPVMIDLGMKYLGLSNYNVDIKTDDALDFCHECAKENKKHDLLLVDIYVGDKIPDKFETEEFIESTKAVLDPDGIAVYNRIYFDENRALAMNFGKKLEKLFKNVTPTYPEANIMFLCYDGDYLHKNN